MIENGIGSIKHKQGYIMQRNKLSLLIVSSILMASSSLPAFATSTNSFNVTGKITAPANSACDVDFGEGGNITMSDVNIDDIAKEIGSVSKTTDFKVHVKDCPASISALTARVDGTADYTDHTLLSISSGTNGETTGFGLQFLVNDAVLPLKEESDVILIKDGQADFTMGARYKTKIAHESLVAGTVNTSGQLVLTYK